MFFQNKNGVFRADLFHFALERRRNLARSLIGDDRDPLLRLHTQTIPDGIARTGLELRIDRDGVGAVGHNSESAQHDAKISRPQSTMRIGI
jgi:hypothetical protein